MQHRANPEHRRPAPQDRAAAQPPGHRGTPIAEKGRYGGRSPGRRRRRSRRRRRDRRRDDRRPPCRARADSQATVPPAPGSVTPAPAASSPSPSADGTAAEAGATGAVQAAHRRAPRPGRSEPFVAPQAQGQAAAASGSTRCRRAAVTSCFGQRWGRLHAGVDLAAPDGTPIRAAGAGIVVAAGAGRGLRQRGADRPRQRLPDPLRPHVGDRGRGRAAVEAGEQIGDEGSTGHSTGPHLHFEVHQGTYKNPIEPTAVDARPRRRHPRLLPCRRRRAQIFSIGAWRRISHITWSPKSICARAPGPWPSTVSTRPRPYRWWLTRSPASTLGVCFSSLAVVSLLASTPSRSARRCAFGVPPAKPPPRPRSPPRPAADPAAGAGPGGVRRRRCAPSGPARPAARR